MNQKEIAMKKILSHNNAKDSPEQTGQQINLKFAGSGMKVKLDYVKPWKDNHEHEKVRRQRQDLFDNWELGDKKPSYTKLVREK